MAAVLVLPPFYLKNPSDQGLVDHLEAVIDGVAENSRCSSTPLDPSATKPMENPRLTAV